MGPGPRVSDRPESRSFPKGRMLLFCSLGHILWDLSLRGSHKEAVAWFDKGAASFGYSSHRAETFY